MKVLEFTIPWRVTSNNVAARRVGRAMIPNPAAVRDKARISTIVLVAVKSQRWEFPVAAALIIIAWNTRKDAGNVEKVVADSMNGIAWSDDKIVTELHVEKRRDSGGERYDVRVESREPLPIVKKARKK
jgi:Holliday junction resolvase RusA-like endonuclease